jgi:hypothetical protein
VLGTAFTSAEAPHLINVSSRGVVSAGNPLLVGFVVTGNAAKRLLVRGIGPGLSALGVAGVLADPRIDLFRSATGSDNAVAAVDNWSDAPNDTAAIVTAAASVGAFPLTAASRDAALLGTFSPGAYTVQLSAVGGTSGTALLEIYDVR